MASKLGHQCSGILAAVIACKFAFVSGHAGDGLFETITSHQTSLKDLAPVVIAAVLGATAPDWLEISSAKQMGDKWVRTSVIPHRTITHWLPAWIVMCIYSYINIQQPWMGMLFGFTVGGLLHLALDIPNPSGVPILHPFKPYKIRINGHYGIWKSGQFEYIIIPLMVLAAYFIAK